MSAGGVLPAVSAIVPAAGFSTRMGNGRSKLLHSICGQTVFERTLGALCRAFNFEQIVVPVRAELEAQFSELPEVRRCAKECRLHFVPGGETRQISVRNGLEYIRHNVAQSAEHFVLVHDAARCLVSAAVVDRCIRGALLHRAVTAAVPLIDTLKRCNDQHRVVETVAREALWAVQTPQVFSLQLLVEAHQRPEALDSLHRYTDDASLVEPLAAVQVIEGERCNIKITTPEDLEIAERLLSAGRNFIAP